MSLLTPEPGLVFWMLLSFGLVVFILVKFGFPVILKSVNDRKEYIDSSLLAAKEAHEELEKVKTTSEALLSETRTEQMQILQTTEQTRAKMVEEAKANAKLEADKIVAEARKQIEAEKQNALQSLRSEIASLSIEVAEKILREKIGNKEEQMNMIDRLLDEIEISKS